MSVQTQIAQHPVSLFCLNLLDIGKSKAKQANITLDELRALPRQTQLLLAHALDTNNSELMLLNCDTDVSPLLSTDWLTPVTCITIGTMCFKIKPQVWRRLMMLCPKFLDKYLQAELPTYKKHKSAFYPWVW